MRVTRVWYGMTFARIEKQAWKHVVGRAGGKLSRRRHNRPIRSAMMIPSEWLRRSARHSTLRDRVIQLPPNGTRTHLEADFDDNPNATGLFAGVNEVSSAPAFNAGAMRTCLMPSCPILRDDPHSELIKSVPGVS